MLRLSQRSGVGGGLWMLLLTMLHPRRP